MICRAYIFIVFKDNYKSDEERLMWARIHRHDERIEKNEESIRQYEEEKALQQRNVQKRKGPQAGTEAKRKMVCTF